MFSSIILNRPLAGPAMKACLAFISGIMFAKHITINPHIYISTLAVAILLLILIRRHDTAGSFMALAVMIFAGFCTATIHNEINKPVDITNIPVNTQVAIEGKITESPRYSYGNTYVVMNCNVINDGTVSYSISGLLPCVFYDRIIQLEEGTRLRIEGNIRRIGYPVNRSDLARGFIKRPYTHRLAVEAALPDPVVLITGNSFFSKLRIHISGLIDRYSYGGHGDILRAMTIGERDGIPKETRIRFAQTGIAHILAVSGLHVGIIAMLFMFMIRPLPVSKTIKYAIVLIFLTIYAGICGFKPPVTRSVILFAMVIGPILFERRKNIENSLFISLLIILAFNPESLFGASLQLSFSAVWFITTFYTPLMNFLPLKIHRKNWLFTYTTGLLLVSILASAGTAPIVAVHFGSIPLYGIIANLPGIPLAFVTVVMGTASIILTAMGYIVSPIAAVISFFTGIALSMLILLTEIVSKLPHASLETGNIPIYVVLGLIFWFYVLSRAGNHQSLQKLLVYIPLILLCIVTWNPLVRALNHNNPKGTVIFFDVGQGDAALVCYDNGRNFLVDAGPGYDNTSPAETVILPSLDDLGIDCLDGIFISHLHSDHTGGLKPILKEIKVNRIFCRMAIRDSLSGAYGDIVTGLSAGDSLNFNGGGIIALSPGKNSSMFDSSSHSGENNCSLIVRCDIAGIRILFTGDVEEDIQKHLVSWGSRLDSDILKVPHHGAKGINRKFVDTVTPSVSVISCGVNNRYNHPDISTLETISNADSKILRTDRQGSLIMKLSGSFILR
ncbi:MAG: DNA internalization-related competence protein ComEC/Rec2 [Candidatus Latescibacteria bacterium]|nr:DNA internalization-related competence protein ComEC/Rec2 [Candidatus Latescibacterota bacterium]